MKSLQPFAEPSGSRASRECAARRRQEDNAEAIQEYNRRVAERGTFSDGRRTF
jgi:post-segregation antitoxin (ccd killing protein)